MYGESRYLLTSLNLPIVSQIIGASEEAPCLAMSLKLETRCLRGLSREGTLRVFGLLPACHFSFSLLRIFSVLSPEADEYLFSSVRTKDNSPDYAFPSMSSQGPP
ncbi:MAG: AraC-type transcriptional regulator N-terminus [Bryobacterales bacterium]|jgi:hypothetical protein|nr:AraC-type transcriptional regulator N-terminus [Bryobacterales bacterium]